MITTPWTFLAVALAGWLRRHEQAALDYLREENGVLRELLGKRRLSFSDAQRRRLAARAKAVGTRALKDLTNLVTPETLLRWYRTLIARKYDGSRCRRPGRPATAETTRKLVLCMARENPRWGFARLEGALRAAGHEISRSTVKRILEAHGLDPAPERARRVSWAQFIKTHLDVLAAADFFAVEVPTLHGFIRHLVFFVIDLATRRVHIAGIAIDPDGAWVTQCARQLCDPDEGFLRGKRFLIHDRDPLYTETFSHVLRSIGTKPLRLPARSPNLNAFAERFVKSIRTECLDHLILWGEGSLRRAVEAYVTHYNAERSHQGIGNRLLTPPTVPVAPSTAMSRSPHRHPGPIRCRERLGGLLKYYFREAS